MRNFFSSKVIPVFKYIYITKSGVDYNTITSLIIFVLLLSTCKIKHLFTNIIVHYLKEQYKTTKKIYTHRYCSIFFKNYFTVTLLLK